MLDNEKYVGRWAWNKTATRRDPRTGKRRRFPKPMSEWIIHEDDELQIVPLELWSGFERGGRRSARPGRVARAVATTAAWALRREERRLANFIDFIGEGRGSQALANALGETERRVRCSGRSSRHCAGAAGRCSRRRRWSGSKSA